jgi:hypothetical protein
VDYKKKVMRVIRGANGTVSESLTQYLSKKPGKHEIKETLKEQPYWTLHTYCGNY